MEDNDEVVKEDISEESTTVLTADMLDNKSEESTTVLTADMLKEDTEKAASEANQQPQGQQPQMAPQGMPPQGQQPQGAPQGMPPMGQPPQGVPMGMPNVNQSGQPPQGMPPQMRQPQQKPMNPPKAQKQPKPQKQSSDKKGKLSGGVIAYIVISIILILGLAGVGTWGYLHYNKKVDNLKSEKEQLENDKTALTDDYESKLDDKDDAIAEYETQIAELEEKVSSYEAEIAGYEASVGEYAAYDALIDFFKNTAVGQGNSDIFVSDTVLHISGSNAKEVKVFCTSEEGVDLEVGDVGVVSCDWTGTWETYGDVELVATLKVTPVSSGSTTVIVKDRTTGTAVKIFVTVD